MVWNSHNKRGVYPKATGSCLPLFPHCVSRFFVIESKPSRVKQTKEHLDTIAALFGATWQHDRYFKAHTDSRLEERSFGVTDIWIKSQTSTNTVYQYQETAHVRNVIKIKSLTTDFKKNWLFQWLKFSGHSVEKVWHFFFFGLKNFYLHFSYSNILLYNTERGKRVWESVGTSPLGYG